MTCKEQCKAAEAEGVATCNFAVGAARLDCAAEMALQCNGLAEQDKDRTRLNVIGILSLRKTEGKVTCRAADDFCIFLITFKMTSQQNYFSQQLEYENCFEL